MNIGRDHSNLRYGPPPPQHPKYPYDKQYNNQFQHPHG